MHRIQTRGHDPSHFTYRILTNTSSFYRLITSNHSIDVVLRQPIVHDREDQVIIRLWSPYSSSPSPSADIHLRFVYRRSHSDYPAVLPHRIDGYVNREDTYSMINLGRLFVTDQTSYPLIHFHLPTNKHFFLKRSSVNHTALYMNSVSQEPALKYSLNLTAVNVRASMSAFNFLHRTTVILPPMFESYSLDVHLFSVDRSMLDQTIVLLFHIRPDLSHEHFIRNNLSLIHARISDILGVQSEDVHLYSFEFKRNSLELLLAVTNHSSMFTRGYIPRDRIYSMLQDSSDTFDEILLDPCRSTTCNHNGRCQSSIELLSNRYDYFSYHKHRRLLPKFQWNITCSCHDHHHGPRCQFKREGISPCMSNDCPSMTTTFECINRNSPTCRGRFPSKLRK